MSWRITGQILDPATGETVNGVITAIIDRSPARTTTGGVIDRPTTGIPIVEGNIIDTPLHSVPGARWTFMLPLGGRVSMNDPGDGASVNIGANLPVGDPVPESEAVLLRSQIAELQATGLKGDKGDPGSPSTVPGPANVLSIGSVTTGAAGSAASAQITGTSPSQRLDLTIPQGARGIQGEPGQPTAFELRGTGMPEGRVTASPGTYYTDTAGTNGAWRWLKKTGTGTTGWDVMTGDTGWRDLTPYLVNGAMRGGGSPGTEFLSIRRSGQVVNVAISLSLASWKSGDTAISFPRAGFSCQSPYVPDGYNNPPNATLAATATTHDFKVYAAITSQGLRWQWSWITPDPWPTTLP